MGRGRAGKTGLIDSLMGRDFKNTASTRGMVAETVKITGELEQERFHVMTDELEERFHVNVEGLKVGGSHSNWSEYKSSSNETEAVIATALTTKRKEIPVPKDTDEIRGEIGGGMSDCPTSVMTQTKSLDIATNEEPKLMPSTATPRPETIVSTSTTSKLSSAARPQQSIDKEEVMKRIGNTAIEESSVVLTVSDLGGQSIFHSLHNLFINKYCVYFVVFNVMWLLDSNHTIVDYHLNEIEFWLNVIFIHTAETNGNAVSTARLVFVGTRKDEMRAKFGETLNSRIEDVSTILEQGFKNHPTWKSRIIDRNGTGRDGHTTLNAFVVDNTNGRNDPSVQSLMSSIKAVVEGHPIVNQKVPLAWLKLLDSFTALVESQTGAIPFNGAKEIAVGLGIPDDGVDDALRFLHDMGVILWHDEEGLRTTVILEPIAYFVEPATRIFCKHRAAVAADELADSNIHFEDCHQRCVDYDEEKWNQLIDHGFLNPDLLPILFADLDVERREVIVRLMLKIGLLAPIGRKNLYLVPALLPPASHPSLISSPLGQISQSCYFSFSIRKSLFEHGFEDYSRVREGCFVPNGLFQRLIGRAAQMRNQQPKYIPKEEFHSNVAILFYGNQRFRLTLLSSEGMIKLDVEGESPLGVFINIERILSNIIRECFKGLIFTPILELIIREEGIEEMKGFLSLESVRAVCGDLSNTNDTTTELRAQGLRLDRDVLLDRYSAWVIQQIRKEVRFDCHNNY